MVAPAPIIPREKSPKIDVGSGVPGTPPS